MKSGARRGIRTPTPQRYWVLNPARLPVPPFSHVYIIEEKKDFTTEVTEKNQSFDLNHREIMGSDLTFLPFGNIYSVREKVRM